MPPQIFRGSTAAEVTEQITKYVRAKIADGISTTDVIAMIVRTPDGFFGTADARSVLLAQLVAMDAGVSADVARETTPRPGFIPLVAMNMVEPSQDIEWLGPFPSESGKTA